MIDEEELINDLGMSIVAMEGIPEMNERIDELEHAIKVVKTQPVIKEDLITYALRLKEHCLHQLGESCQECQFRSGRRCSLEYMPWQWEEIGGENEG